MNKDNINVSIPKVYFQELNSEISIFQINLFINRIDLNIKSFKVFKLYMHLKCQMIIQKNLQNY